MKSGGFNANETVEADEVHPFQINIIHYLKTWREHQTETHIAAAAIGRVEEAVTHVQVPSLVVPATAEIDLITTFTWNHGFRWDHDS